MPSSGTGVNVQGAEVGMVAGAPKIWEEDGNGSYYCFCSKHELDWKKLVLSVLLRSLELALLCP